MTSSMLTMPYMTSLLDQAKTHYTITDKSTGEVLGYAFMLVDDQVTPDQVQLLPWHAQGEATELHPPPSILTVDDITLIPAASLASDLDISDESSMNATAEDFFFSPRPADDIDIRPEISVVSQLDSNANNTQTSPKYVSLPQGNNCFNVAALNDHHPSPTTSPFPISVKSVTESIGAQIAAQLLRESSKVKSDGNVNVIDKDIVVKKGSTVAVNSEDLVVVVTGKRRSDVDIEPPAAKKVNVEKFHQAQFTPGKPGRYSAFYTSVGVDQPVDKKHKRVRCLLCSEEKISSVPNFGDHVRAMHEPPVKCSSCGREYSAGGINKHKKKCIGNRLDCLEVNKKAIMRSTEAVPEAVPEAVLEAVPIETFDNSSTVTVPVRGSTFRYVCSKDDLSRTVGSQSAFKPTPTLTEGCSNVGVLGGSDKIIFTVSSATAEGVRFKIEVMKGAKIKKVMKKFGKKVGVCSKKLKFILSGQRLSGEELAGDLKERYIVVVGELNTD